MSDFCWAHCPKWYTAVTGTPRPLSSSIAFLTFDSMPSLTICFCYLSSVTKREPNGQGMEASAQKPEADRVGLCAHCKHVRRITSDRGSRFYLCRRSATDPSFPKYPRLPVVQCRGYEENS
jgi:hypothetical protein